MNHLKGIPVEIEEIARTLGGNSWQVIRHVLIPMLWPAIGLSMAVSTLISGSEYFSTFLIGGGNVITLPMLMYPYITNNDYGLSSVTGIIFVVVYLVTFRVSDKLSKSSNQMGLLYVE